MPTPYSNSPQNDLIIEGQEESKQEVILQDPIQQLKKFQQAYPWIRLAADVFSYPWPQTINLNPVFSKLLRLKVFSFNLVQLLLISGIWTKNDPKLEEAKDFRGANALHYAALSGNVPLVQTIVELGYSKDSKTHLKETALHFAALGGDFDALNALILLDFDSAARNKLGATVLHYAAQSGNHQLVLNLIEVLGYNKRSKTIIGETILHFAALSGNPKSVQNLIGLGLAKDTRTEFGATVLHYAAQSGKLEAILALIDLGYDQNVKTSSDGVSLLHFAALSGNPQLVESLIALGFDKDAKNIGGETILHYAARSGNLQAVEALIDLGFDKYVQAQGGITLLEEALIAGNVSLVIFMIEQHGLSRNTWPGVGALYNKNPDMLEFFTKVNPQQLYRKYLTSFIRRQMQPLSSIIHKDLLTLIEEYAAPSSEDQQALELSIKQYTKKSKEILKPLIDYCDRHFLNNQGARKLLNEFAPQKLFGIPALESRLDSMINSEMHQGKVYTELLVDCRLNAVKIGGQEPKVAKNRLFTPQKIRRIQNHYFLLQAMRMLAGLGVLTAISCVIASALILTGAAFIGGIATAVLIGGLSTYSFFKSHKEIEQEGQLLRFAMASPEPIPV